jgi:Protein of unknown function (DUF2505)
VHLQVQLHYRADAPTVAGMLANPDFGITRVAASGAIAHQVDVVGESGGAFTVTTRRSMPTDEIPANIRPFVGTSLEVRQVEAWGEPGPEGRRGTVVVEISGAPVRLTGTISLEPDGAHASLVTYAGEMKAGVPLFSAAIEDAAARAVRAALAAEQDAGNAWLDDHPHRATA